MNLDQIQAQCFIMSLFIRDDGERFLLGSGAYQFNKKQLHFEANKYQNDLVEVQGNDGIMLAGQVRRGSTQDFDGYIGDASLNKQEIENYRKAFFMFFRKNYYYKVVYIMPDGTAIQRQRGFIVDAPEVKELWQIYPEYHIALNFEDINYYEYAENSSGQEIYGKSATVSLSIGARDGGIIWDEYGATWDNYGMIWEATTGSSYTTIAVDSIDIVYPIWEVTGPATNPELANLTTNTTLYYSGNIANGQKLVIDMNNKTAMLNGSSVIKNVSGDWVYLASGNNKISYTTDNNDAVSSTLKWQEVVG
jgi:hypothetical protein